jgi:hypothetical protein
MQIDAERYKVTLASPRSLLSPQNIKLAFTLPGQHAAEHSCSRSVIARHRYYALTANGGAADQNIGDSEDTRKVGDAVPDVANITGALASGGTAHARERCYHVASAMRIPARPDKSVVLFRDRYVTQDSWKIFNWAPPLASSSKFHLYTRASPLHAKQVWTASASRLGMHWNENDPPVSRTPAPPDAHERRSQITQVLAAAKSSRSPAKPHPEPPASDLRSPECRAGAFANAAEPLWDQDARISAGSNHDHMSPSQESEGMHATHPMGTDEHIEKGADPLLLAMPMTRAVAKQRRAASPMRAENARQRANRLWVPARISHEASKRRSRADSRQKNGPGFSQTRPAELLIPVGKLRPESEHHEDPGRVIKPEEMARMGRVFRERFPEPPSALSSIPSSGWCLERITEEASAWWRRNYSEQSETWFQRWHAYVRFVRQRLSRSRSKTARISAGCARRWLAQFLRSNVAVDAHSAPSSSYTDQSDAAAERPAQTHPVPISVRNGSMMKRSFATYPSYTPQTRARYRRYQYRECDMISLPVGCDARTLLRCFSEDAPLRQAQALPAKEPVWIRGLPGQGTRRWPGYMLGTLDRRLIDVDAGVSLVAVQAADGNPEYVANAQMYVLPQHQIEPFRASEVKATFAAELALRRPASRQSARFEHAFSEVYALFLQNAGSQCV